VNYQALAWQVIQLRDAAESEGKKLSKAEAVRIIMRQSAKNRVSNSVDARLLVQIKFRTAYDEVRKILKKWEQQRTKN
jgi:hypothetical protein